MAAAAEKFVTREEYEAMQATVMDLKTSVEELQRTVRKNSDDILKNSEDIRKNSEDIRELQVEVRQNGLDIKKLQIDVRALQDRLDETKHELKVEILEARAEAKADKLELSQQIQESHAALMSAILTLGRR